ncbi:N-acetylmuramoyl-L-alanine amidase [Gordonia amicalis]|uniref:N-acetylmuramoyl-L-alanine amidase n=1 Tax=Gordonia amicalis TaxID=89053 RepID=A0AAE4R7E5_9ACTN|nr:MULTISPECIES: N-acetylmuramoyl-L-alanine amidase [Gordonia]ATD71746.1 cell wall hydrolase [Gordonia sp. 1D]MBA5847756.1 N-acetylmuramoyl-L-alanine amidase [Gordonia amicalis]MCZ4581223.1 N-acetylmuramoyl-L-alanine amidase [Gordonia amicalis]MDV6313477.1 N-acetylmuramoyl-L-alanine amidase [Gordonia amicalis]UKO94181.1 N-acetylmuramoyl-L-alanine amidase [Gordonia amicalis]
MFQKMMKKRMLTTAFAVTAMASTVMASNLVVAPAQAVPARGTALAGKTIFLDPGHQASAAGRSLSAQVSDGRGGKKDCQTTGATGVNGAEEHTVNWQITQLVKAGLESQGARVVLSRPDDLGWGGCVDERAAAASRSGAAVAVSLHADSTSRGADGAKKGFHMIVPSLPIPDATVNRVQSGEGRKASTVMRDSFIAAGFPSANYAGVNNGIQTRPDIAAVNLTKVPAVFIEMGNLSNPAEAAALAGRDGQLKYATAITDGILKYVNGNAATGAGPAPSVPPADDASGLSAVIPFVQQLLATEEPEAVVQLLATQGQDVSAQVLKAMLTILYGLFDGKLPIG